MVSETTLNKSAPVGEIRVSTPSRLCLFGEHLDYLGLEVIACAIDLRFSARIRDREDGIIEIFIRDSRIDTLGMKNESGNYERYEINPGKPIIYKSSRDYLKSAVAVLLRNNIRLGGFSIVMDSEIPIGKGMCSSSTMIVVLIKALLEGVRHEARNDPEKIAYWAYLAEVEEFGEPGGMMDHFTSAVGGLLNLDFSGGRTTVNKFDAALPGCFILFDSKEQKNTTAVLSGAKEPALRALKAAGMDIRDIVRDDIELSRFDMDMQAMKVFQAACSNYRILLEAKTMLESGEVDNGRFGELLYLHHCNLRDGLGISTPSIEQILDTAMSKGALGGKINGSGGGGCCFVYAHQSDAVKIFEAVRILGFPGQILLPDSGVRVDEQSF
ncbi:MAG: GHMP family kinase ATP-binding protein [Saccharofermentanales bacterium]